MHFGVKGMKWGVRRYQNEDGSLTDSGKKKMSKKYQKLAIKTEKRLDKTSGSRYVKAYNKTADEMNNGLIDKYNKAYEKKHGKNAYGDDKYAEGYNKLLDKTMQKNISQLKLDQILSDKNFKKAKSLCDQYNMTSFDKLEKDNAEYIQELKSYLK